MARQPKRSPPRPPILGSKNPKSSRHLGKHLKNWSVRRLRESLLLCDNRLVAAPWISYYRYFHAVPKRNLYPVGMSNHWPKARWDLGAYESLMKSITSIATTSIAKPCPVWWKTRKQIWYHLIPFSKETNKICIQAANRYIQIPFCKFSMKNKVESHHQSIKGVTLTDPVGIVAGHPQQGRSTKGSGEDANGGVDTGMEVDK